MKTKFKLLAPSTKAALTVVLLWCLAPTAYSGTVSHLAILDAYDGAYTTGGILVHSTSDNYTTVTTLQLPYDVSKLCKVFGPHVDAIVFTNDDYSTVNVDCKL